MNEEDVLDHLDGNRDDRGDGELSEPGPVDAPIARHRPARLVVNVGDLRRRLGQRRSEDIEVRLHRQSVVASRTTDEPVRGSVVVESIERGVSVSGSLHFTWEGDCRRCLEVTSDRLEVDIYEIFQVDAPEDSELIDFDGDQIDLVPVVPRRGAAVPAAGPALRRRLRRARSRSLPGDDRDRGRAKKGRGGSRPRPALGRSRPTPTRPGLSESMLRSSFSGPLRVPTSSLEPFGFGANIVPWSGCLWGQFRRMS